MSERLILYPGAFLFVLAGLALILLAWRDTRRDQQFRESAIVISAKIVGYDEIQRASGPVYAPVFEFEKEDGVVVRMGSKIFSNFGLRKVGASVNVVYSKKYNRVELAPGPDWKFWFPFYFGGAFNIIAGFGAIFAMLKTDLKKKSLPTVPPSAS